MATGGGAASAATAAFALTVLNFGAMGLYRSLSRRFSFFSSLPCVCWLAINSGCSAMDELVDGAGTEGAAAGVGFGMDPEPDRYGLLDRAFCASIRALTAARRSATDWSIFGAGGRDAGPAGPEDDDVGAAVGAGEAAAGRGEADPDPLLAASRAAFFAAICARIDAMSKAGFGGSILALLGSDWPFAASSAGRRVDMVG